MIRVVNGIVIGHGKDHLIIELGGAIGLKVFATEPTLAQVREGDVVRLHTYLQVREDALTLFGFSDEEELAIFDLLTKPQIDLSDAFEADHCRDTRRN